MRLRFGGIFRGLRRLGTVALPVAALLVAVAAGAVLPLCAEDTALATSGVRGFVIDTRPSPRAVTTAAEHAELAEWEVWRQGGGAVTLTAPGGAASTLAGSTLVLNAGGLWRLSGASLGEASFTVRHALAGTQGGGTAASPAKIVDGAELADLAAAGAAGDGYVFTLDGADTLLGALRLPEGYRLEEAGDGLWRIVASADGREYAWAEITYPIDSVQPGPDRKAKSAEALPVAYSGDGWLGDAAKASTLTFVSPDGAETSFDLTGTGAQAFTFGKPGKWTVRLATADGTTREAVVSVSDGFAIVIR